METIYEFIDDKGRHFFMKNEHQFVSILGINGGAFMGYLFKNTPQFNSFIPAQESVQNNLALYKTEANLDKYLITKVWHHS